MLDGGGVTAGWGGRREGAGRPGGRLALADWEIDELLSMHRRGASLSEIATRFSLSRRTVARYLRRFGDDGR